MDEFEKRLHDELEAAGRNVAASDSLGSAVRRRVRRRQTFAGALAALPVALLLVGALWLLDTDVDVVATTPPTSTLVTSSSTTLPAPPVDDPLQQALIALGAAVDTTPPEAVTLGDAEWCGVDEISGLTGELDDVSSSGCLIDATEAGRDAAMVRVETTIEGDPIVTVAWTRSALFEAPVYIDSSQDEFGRPGWTELRCDLTVDESAPVLLTWQNCVEPGTDRLRDALVEVGADVTTAPIEATTLGDAAWCGVDGPDMVGDLHAPLEVAQGLLTGESDPTADRVMVRLEDAEGGGIVHVLRWRETRGEVDVYSDESQMSEGISVWTSQQCRLAIEGIDLPAPIIWTDCGPDPPDDIDGADDQIDPPCGPGVEIGQSYDYSLYTHCGIEWAQIEGVWWQTPAPLDDGNANPPPGWGNPFDSGTMEVVDETTAVYRGGPDSEVEFSRTEVTERFSDCD